MSGNGIEIDDAVRQLLISAEKQEGGTRKLARVIDVSPMTITIWLGRSKYKPGHYIAWDVWHKVRNYLTMKGLINADDKKWLTPDELKNNVNGMTENEQKALSLFRAMNEEGQKAAIGALMGLVNLYPKDQNLQSLEAN